jgi:hypothetical protein
MTAVRKKLLGEFLAAWLRKFQREHPDVKVRFPFDAASGKFEVTEQGVLTTYERGTEMIVDLWDRYPEPAIRDPETDDRPCAP